MASADLRPLIELPRHLRAVYGVPVSYNALYRLAVDGSIPVERMGSRWMFDPADTPLIGQALGLANSGGELTPATLPAAA